MITKQKSTQIAVIGGGPGGYAAAFLAADLGKEVTLVDLEANPGGVCLYRGCIPSKALLHIARVIEESREAEQWGVKFTKPKLDVNRMRAWKDEVVTKLTGGLGELSSRRKVDYIRGRAHFQDARTLAIDLPDGSEEIIAFDHAILATGSRPTMPPFVPKDSKRVLDSTTALELPEIPKTMLVIGGGYIGLELGSVYAALGTRVTVVEMTDTLLPGADGDLVKPLARRMDKVMHAIHLKTKVAGLEETAKGVKVKLEGAVEAEEVYDYVLVAIGRRPSTEGLGLEHTRVKIDDHGFVEVNLQRRTAEETIYAIGDVAGQPMLAHKASHEGRIAVEAIAGHQVAFEPAAIPAVVFTNPEVAWAGLTENEAKARGIQVAVARFPWQASGRAMTLGNADGLTKILVDPETERVLGIGICGTGAGELIAEGVLAIEMGAVLSDVSLSIHAHPTLSETVMESAESFFGTATHIYRPKRRDD